MTPIGSYCLSNNTSFNVYDIDHSTDMLFAGINEDLPEWFPIFCKNYEGPNHDETRFYVRYGSLEIFLDEIMRV